jgi:hypothetical protein
MMTNFKRKFKNLFKIAKDNPKVSIGIVIVVVILYTLIF